MPYLNLSGPGSRSSGSHSRRFTISDLREDKPLAVGIGVLVVLISAVTFFFYAPGPAKYTITPQELTIHDRFLPGAVRAAEVDTEGIRVVDVGKDPHWHLTERTNGIGLLHYRVS